MNMATTWCECHKSKETLSDARMDPGNIDTGGGELAKHFDVWAFWMMCICKFPFAEVLLVCGNVLLTLVHRFPDSFVSCSPCACPGIYSQSWWTSDFLPVAIFVKPPHRLSVWSALNSVARCWNTLWETCSCNNSLSQAVDNFWWFVNTFNNLMLTF